MIPGIKKPQRCLRLDTPALFPERPNRRDDVEDMWVNYLLDCIAVMSAAHQPQTAYAATAPTIAEAIHWYTCLHNIHGLWRSRTAG